MQPDSTVETGADNFLKANAESLVVEGQAIGRGGEGCYYTLENGRRFRLTIEDCRQVGHPKWKID